MSEYIYPARTNKLISPGSKFHNLHSDRAMDENGEVFFLHLGRGIVKSVRKYKEKRTTTPEQWVNFAKNFILVDSYIPERLPYDELSPLFSRLDYSLRRYYVDEFFKRNISIFPKSAIILDIGGKKVRKRGQFDIENHLVTVKYANIDSQTNPDYLCDGSKIPVGSNSFDGVICSEVLEHVKEPVLIIKEAFRVLKPSGLLLISVPFLVRTHPDPSDYGRYTDKYWSIVLKEAGFINVFIEKQGLYPSFLADSIRGGIYEMRKDGRPRHGILKWLLTKIVFFIEKKAFDFEERNYIKCHPYFTSYTTGYGIKAEKP